MRFCVGFLRGDEGGGWMGICPGVDRAFGVGHYLGFVGVVLWNVSEIFVI